MENWFNTIKKSLLDKTQQGLDIIAWLVPNCDTTRIQGNKGTKQFKSPFRNEKTPSCSLFFNEKSGQWGITDFGASEGQWTSAIDLYMRFNHISQDDVATALLELAMRFDIPTASGEPVLKKPQVTIVESKEQKPFEYKICQWTPLHVSVFNPKANHNSEEGKALYNELVKSAEFYGLFPVSEYSTDYTDKEGNLKRRTVKATGVFPLFLFIQGNTPEVQKQLHDLISSEQFEEAAKLRDQIWGKIYQPYAKEKQHRFFHFGKKPERFIYGLDQLKANYDGQLSAELKKLGEDPDHKLVKKLKSEFKIPEVILCSGGSDGLNITALGFYAMWSNSESNFINTKEYLEIKKYAHEVYYVGDIDDAGKAAAHRLGLTFLDIRIIRLPEELKKYRGWRDQQAKDVKDYCRYYSASQFRGLLQIACPYKFWSFNPSSKAAIPYTFEPMWALHFLHYHGFYKFRNKTQKSGYDLVHVDGNVVTKLEPDDIKTFLKNFALERRESKEVINLLLRTKAIREEFARDLEWFNGSFKRHTASEQFWFFPDKIWRIHADGTEVMKPGSINVYTWSDKVYTVPDRPEVEIKITDDLFSVEHLDTGEYRVNFKSLDHQFLQFMVNISRVHWMEEFKLNGVEANIDQAEATRLNLNTLTGDKLKPEQRQEQVLHFLSKVTMVGYLLHTYKAMGKEWAPWITENTERDVKEAHGGTGKSLFLKPIHTRLLHTVWKDGRNIKDEKFLFGSVDSTHELFVVADADRSTSLSPYYNAVTDGMENRTLYSLGNFIPFEDAPKIAFISNFIPWDMNPSDMRRLWLIGFSDYYHAIGGLHNEDRNPLKDFGKAMYTDWTSAEWVEFYNIMRLCIQTYLKFGRIDPPMGDINRQMAKVQMGQNFEAWARDYFTHWLNEVPNEFVPTVANCQGHKMVPLKLVHHDYMEYLKQIRASGEKMSEAGLLKKIQSYAKYNRFIFNPVSLRNASGRIQRKIGKDLLQKFYDDKKFQSVDLDQSSTVGKIKSLTYAPGIVLTADKVVDMVYLAVHQDLMPITEQTSMDFESDTYEPPHDAF